MKKYKWLIILISIFLLGKFICNKGKTPTEKNPLINQLEFTEMTYEQKEEVLRKIKNGTVDPYKDEHNNISYLLTKIVKKAAAISHDIHASWEGRIIDVENGLVDLDVSVYEIESMKLIEQLDCGLIYKGKGVYNVITYEELQSKIKRLEYGSLDTPEDYQRVLNKKLSPYRGAGSIKSSKFNNGVLLIEFVTTFKEYKDKNPNFIGSKKDWELHWSTGDAVIKTLVDYAGRVFKDFEFVNSVSIKIPYKGKVYSINTNREDLEKYTKTSIPKMERDWTKNYVDVYIYNKEQRNRFFKHFGRVK